MTSYWYYLTHPNVAIMGVIQKYGQWIPSDEFVIRCLYRLGGKKLNLTDPKSFNEKIQWLKLNDRNPLYSTLVDKHLVKEYVAGILGDEYIIPTLAVYERGEDIEWEKLPDQFVLKANHDSGSVLICKDKRTFDRQAAINKLNKALKQDSYKPYREWAYKNVKKCIIAEAYLEDESRNELKDYKIFCFNGKPRVVQLDYSRFSGHKRNLYTVDWERIDVEYNNPTDKERIFKKPNSLDVMLEAAKKLSKDLPFVRCDFYDVNGKVYFGELTFYPEGGFGWFKPESFGNEMGSWLELPIKRE